MHKLLFADYSMVNFIKPLYLGTEKEFANLYCNPIKNGQHKDSSKKDITVMKQRSFVLHKKLSKFVQVRICAHFISPDRTVTSDHTMAYWPIFVTFQWIFINLNIMTVKFRPNRTTITAVVINCVC